MSYTDHDYSNLYLLFRLPSIYQIHSQIDAMVAFMFAEMFVQLSFGLIINKIRIVFIILISFNFCYFYAPFKLQIAISPVLAGQKYPSRNQIWGLDVSYPMNLIG